MHITLKFQTHIIHDVGIQHSLFSFFDGSYEKYMNVL